MGAARLQSGQTLWNFKERLLARLLQHQGGNLKSDQEEQNSLDGDGDRKNQTIALKTDQKEVTMKRRLAEDKSMMELLNLRHQSSSVIHN